MISPLGKGIFQQAILESPGALRPLASLEEAETVGRTLGSDLAAMRAMSADEVLAKTTQFVPKVRGLTTPRVLRPIRDGWVIDRGERTSYLAGGFTPVPMIVGSNLDEGGLFVGAWPVKTVADFRELVTLNFGKSTQQALREYPVERDADVFRQCVFLFGDTQFTYGARGIARANSAREPATYRYLFSRRRGDIAEPPKHGEEVPYVFGRVSKIRTEDPPANFRDETLSQQIMDAWVCFAASGDPNGGSLSNWPRYNAARDSYLEFGDTLGIGSGWRASQMEFLDAFFDAKSKVV